MIITVRVCPRSSRNKIVEADGKYKAYLTRPAQDGEANAQLIDLLAGQMKLKKYQFKIIKGLKSRDKLVEIVP